MDRNRKLLYGGIAAVVVLVVTIILVSSRRSESDVKIENIVNEKYNVVANMMGYLQLVGDENNHQSVGIRKASFAWDHDDPSQRFVSLIGKRFGFTMSYYIGDKHPSGENFYEFSKLEMVSKNLTRPVGDSKICDFDKEFKFWLPVDTRYSCKKTVSHQCSKDGKPVANLVLQSFELELDGDLDHVERGEFSKPAWKDSCESWDG